MAFGKIHICLLITTAFSLCRWGLASQEAQWEEKLLAQGQDFYTAGEFESALRSFEQLTSISPKVSEHHHWLGKVYGQIAQRAGWLRAMSLAKKARRSFETAVSLDPSNAAALLDLLRYYARAPKFLGGSQRRASELAERIERIDPSLGAKAHKILAEKTAEP